MRLFMRPHIPSSYFACRSTSPAFRVAHASSALEVCQRAPCPALGRSFKKRARSQLQPSYTSFPPLTVTPENGENCARRRTKSPNSRTKSSHIHARRCIRTSLSWRRIYARPAFAFLIGW
jgi:hypothetical protein